jgi:UDP-2-acetamido-2,6-beta-L-arabino-hexul-4-ose reductase
MGAVRSVAITGGTGFLGFHLRARLRALAPDVDVRVIGRAEYDDARLLAALTGVDSVVHLAGANKGSDEAVHHANVSLAQRLVGALEDVGGSPSLVYANTIHAGADSAYAISKRKAAVVLETWGARVGARVVDLRFPNLYGEGGRPHYNSAVATFCADLAAGRTSEVNPGGWTELLHAQDASALVLDALENEFNGSRRVAGQGMPIPEVYERLQRLRSGYHAAALPELRDRLDLGLFNQLRTAMFPEHYAFPLNGHRDARGLFVEVARGSGQTQTSFGTTAPGYTRGDHFHLEKVERFVVLAGSGVIKLRRLFDTEVFSFAVSGTQPTVVDMPPLYAHSLTNVSTDDLLTMFWANDHFNPAAPDTYAELVEPVSVGVNA